MDDRLNTISNQCIGVSVENTRKWEREICQYIKVKWDEKIREIFGNDID